MSNQRIALVTGCSQGIGRAIVLRLASDGYNIAMNDLSVQSEALFALREELVSKFPEQQFIVVIANVSVEDEVQRMFEATINQLGGLDVLVANAGCCGTLIALTETPLSHLESLLDVNIKGTFLCFQHAARQMIKQGRGGRIIGASSQAGKQGCPMLAAYSASKFAVRGLTQAAAAEWGPHGITVNSYAPGAVVTEMTRALPKAIGLDVDKFFEEQANIPPLKRNGGPEDIAGVVSFLASKDSSYMTGQTVSAVYHQSRMIDTQ